MIVGLTADTYQRIPVSFVLHIMRWVGIPFSEVTQNVFVHPERVLKNSQRMKLGLHLPNVGNFGYDLSSLECREKVEWVLAKITRYGELFDFRYAIFHPPEEDSPGQSFDFYIDNLHQIQIPLVLENPRGWSLDRFNCFFRDICNKLENRLHGICLDIPHAYLSGENWIDFYRTFRDQIRVVHLSDCSGDEDLHLPFGCGGDLDLHDILNTLYREKFDGILNFEMKPPSLNHLDSLFETYLQTSEFFLPDKNRKMKCRMKVVSLLGKCMGLLFK